MTNRFNLVEEPWIPVVGKGRVSLAAIFSDPGLTALGGNPVQKIALTKLLLAIAQSAYTPIDEEDWRRMGASGMAKKSLDYLQANRDLFWLYGEMPFLQMPEIAKAHMVSLGSVQAHIASGNTTILTQIQTEIILDDADKAILLVQMMGFALGGKKTDNSVVLTPGYILKANEKGKPSTGKPGPSIGFQGFLHSFLLGSNLQESIWLNLFSEEYISYNKIFSAGVGTAPWEKMPLGEDCAQAKILKESYMGRLVPLARFVLLNDVGIHYSEGIAHRGYAEAMADPSVAVDYSSTKAKVLWVDPEKRPWRQLSALLSFMGNATKVTFDCIQLRMGISRISQQRIKFGVWSGGLKVSSNAGEQYVSGSNDFVESEILLDSTVMEKDWYPNLKAEMDALDGLSKMLYGATLAYYKAQNAEGKSHAEQASSMFWQLCERKFQDLVNACNDPEGGVARSLRKVFAGYARKAYDTYCPRDTARQLDAWAAHQLQLGKYLAQ